jgi:hypothetical protein
VVVEAGGWVPGVECWVMDAEHSCRELKILGGTRHSFRGIRARKAVGRLRPLIGRRPAPPCNPAALLVTLGYKKLGWFGKAMISGLETSLQELRSDIWNSAYRIV